MYKVLAILALAAPAAALVPSQTATPAVSALSAKQKAVDVTTREAYSAWSVQGAGDIQETRADTWYESLKAKKMDKAAILDSHKGFFSMLGRGAAAASATESMGLGAPALAKEAAPRVAAEQR